MTSNKPCYRKRQESSSSEDEDNVKISTNQHYLVNQNTSNHPNPSTLASKLSEDHKDINTYDIKEQLSQYSSNSNNNVSDHSSSHYRDHRDCYDDRNSSRDHRDRYDDRNNSRDHRDRYDNRNSSRDHRDRYDDRNNSRDHSSKYYADHSSNETNYSRDHRSRSRSIDSHSHSRKHAPVYSKSSSENNDVLENSFRGYEPGKKAPEKYTIPNKFLVDDTDGLGSSALDGEGFSLDLDTTTFPEKTIIDYSTRSDVPQLNSIHKGIVQKVLDFGAFVKIRGYPIDGLVYKEEYIYDLPPPKPDDEVFVKVIRLFEKDGKTKISLSIRRVSQDKGKDLDSNPGQSDSIFKMSTIQLDAQKNCVCSRCGVKGHLASECFVNINTGKKYDLVEDSDIDSIDEDIQAKDNHNEDIMKPTNKGNSVPENRTHSHHKHHHSSSNGSTSHHHRRRHHH
ncbi:hypothetical protein WA158_005496 [Blastocystis sp. Blastoise]